MELRRSMVTGLRGASPDAATVLYARARHEVARLTLRGQPSDSFWSDFPELRSATRYAHDLLWQLTGYVDAFLAERTSSGPAVRSASTPRQVPAL
jgi:hypothetical protein